MQKITPFLMYNDGAEEAVQLYTSVFGNAKIISKQHMPDGKMFSATIELDGQLFNLMNGGPYFKFEQGISLFVSCDTQEEIDDKWAKLSAGGQELQCGWLKDKFGVSWQIVPPVLGRLLGDPDPAKAKRVLDAMMQMKKLDIKTLEEA